MHFFPYIVYSHRSHLSSLKNVRIKWKEPVSNGAYIDRYQLQLKEYTAFDLKEAGGGAGGGGGGGGRGEIIHKSVIPTRNSPQKSPVKKSSEHAYDNKNQVNFTS
jgi:hypothetical protein